MLEEKIESAEICDSPLVENSDTICVEIVLKKKNDREKFKVLCTSEVVELVKEKYHFITDHILGSNTISNIDNNNRKGKWTFAGKYEVSEEEKWLFRNPEAINSVMKGIEQAEKGEVSTLTEVMARLATKLDTLPEEKQAELERKINKKIGKSKKLVVEKKE